MNVTKCLAALAMAAVLNSSSLAQEPEPGRLVLFMATGQSRQTAQEAWKRWDAYRGPKEIVLVVTSFKTLEDDLIQWVDVVPRELALFDENGLALLRRYDVRRLPCFLYFDGRKAHRTCGIPRKEVTSCSR
jgi:hypothetical protein